MKENRVSIKYRSVNIIRSTVLSASIAILLCPIFSGIYVIIPVSAFLFTLLLIFYYIPKRGKSIKFYFDRDKLILHSGVWFFREDVIPLSSIRYEERIATPLQRLLGVYDLVLYLPKGRIKLPCLEKTNEMKWFEPDKNFDAE